MERMTTAEATVEGLIAHGLDTIYALPGVHNDHLFDALFKAKDRIRTVHTRHEQGAGLHGAGRGARDRQAAGLCRRAGTGPAQFRDRAAERPRHQRAGAGADRPDRPGRHRPRLWPPARNPRPGRHHLPHCRPHRPHQIAGRGPCPGRRRVPRHALGPSRTGGARMRHGRVGQERPGRAAGHASCRRSRRSTTTRSPRPPSGSPPPSAS